jgi:tetratricopeptide (TPR) repeat protein
MKKIVWITGSILTSFLITSPSMGENLNHVSQLLNTKKCINCDLTNTGLVMSNLAGADLTGADLTGANLSNANLRGANFSNANLTGASLNGANLTGANLSNAILNTTDLRNAYVVNADFSNVDFTTSYIEGVIGIPKNAADAEQFYLWALAEDKQGNYQAALRYYNQVIEFEPDFAPAYLGRAVIYSRLGNTSKAIQNAEKAQELFELEENQESYQLASNFIEFVKIREGIENEEDNQGSPEFVQIVNTLGPLLLKFVLP